MGCSGCRARAAKKAATLKAKKLADKKKKEDAAKLLKKE
jgi:hypothetical protein